MDNFKFIYKILRYLEQAMDFSELDPTPIEAEALGISEDRWNAIFSMLYKNGYVEGLLVKTYVHCTAPVVVNLRRARITLKGLEYLHENSTMKKIANAAKGIVETII